MSVLTTISPALTAISTVASVAGQFLGAKEERRAGRATERAYRSEARLIEEQGRIARQEKIREAH